MKKFLSLVLGSILLMSMFIGCGGSTTGGAGSASSSETASGNLPKEIRIGTMEMPNDEGIAKSLKYLEDEMGVPVKITVFDSSSDVNTALASGSIDISLIGSCGAAIAISRNLGVDLIWIHEVLGKVESLVARNDTGIKSIADLKGKTVAVPFSSTTHFSLLKAMESEGLSASDVNLLDMQTSEIYAAWENKQIDATYVWEPTLSKLNDATLITTSEEMAAKGFITSNMEVVSKDFADKYPELVTKYIEIMDKSVKLFKEDKASAVKAISNKLQIDEKDAQFQMEGSLWLTAEEQMKPEYLGTSDAKGAIVDNLYETAQFLKDQKSIESVPDKKVFEDCVNPKFLEAAAKK